MCLALATAGTSWAQEVSAEVSSSDVFVGVPFEVRIVVKDARPDTIPMFPETEDLIPQGAPSESRFGSEMIINGRRIGSMSTTLSYRVVPRREGIARIPALQVVVDGQTFETRPMAVRVSGPNGGDRLIVEIIPDREIAYLGAPLGLTLQVWVKPFEHEVLNGRASDQQMWNFMNLYQSAWGDFAQSLTSLVGRTGTRPLRGRLVNREIDGQPVPYYLFEVGHTAWPQQTGRLSLQQVIVRMEYPTQIDAARRRVSDQDDLLAVGSPPDINVRAAPTEGRPAAYAGAIGRFDISVRAMPTEVAVGDPITLTINVIDNTPDGTILDVLQPPRLELVPELVEGFRMPDDPLAGVVRGRVKTFTQTIRAMDDAVTEVPSIPYVYFDPETERFETAWSAPIPLVVDAGSSVAMSDVVAGERPATSTTELTALDDGLLANISDVAEVLDDERPRPVLPLLLIAGVPPLLTLLLGVVAARTRRLRDDHGYARRRRSMSNARRRLGKAQQTNGGDATLVASAITSYIGDRTDAPAGTTTRADVRALLDGRVPDDLIMTVDTLLGDCEQAAFAGGSVVGADDLVGRAESCLDALARERL